MDGGRGSFKATYQIDENHPTFGFNSWDEFFVRKFKKDPEDVRPLLVPPGAERKRLIFNPCESTAERWRVGVKDHDRFWLKGMPYSLYDIFHDPDAQEGPIDQPGTHEHAEATAKTFNGGTIYQAFLSPQDYHRWHSPIDGQIKAAYIIPGTYYAVLPDEGRYDDEIEPSGAIIRCQPWLTVAATRAVFVISGEHVGDVGFVAIGMVEVSTCDIQVEVGQIVKAGDELGMFHFGGSSHALIFNPEAKIKLDTEEVIKKQRHIHLKKLIGVSAKA
jgi:phosphatidylserine decarboxylase